MRIEMHQGERAVLGGDRTKFGQGDRMVATDSEGNDTSPNNRADAGFDLR